MTNRQPEYQTARRAAAAMPIYAGCPCTSANREDEWRPVKQDA